MKKLNKMTSYELWNYGSFDEWNVKYIQFDFNSNLKYHQIGEIITLQEHYDEWDKNGRNNEIFTALIKWFYIECDKHLLVVCLTGVDGRLHYENE